MDVVDKSQRVLGIFAKEPLAGGVKTRMSPPLSAVQAADFYRVCLEETVTRMRGGSFEAVIFYAGDAEFFNRAFPGTRLIPQGEGGLGERMARALAGLLDHGRRAAMLIGSDSPDLPLALVEDAFAALEKNQLVLAPSIDGGYVLIGESCHHPELFCNIPWSTEQVLPLTRSKAAELGLDYRELGHWEDVDDLASLQRLIRRSPNSRTARFARQNLKAILDCEFIVLN